jgi:hypothetical protein
MCLFFTHSHPPSAVNTLSSLLNEKKILFGTGHPILILGIGKNEKEEKHYSDDQNDDIEQAFQQRQKQMQLDDYPIDFGCYVQLNKNVRKRRRRTERCRVDVSECFQEERLSFRLKAAMSFDQDFNKNRK